MILITSNENSGKNYFKINNYWWATGKIRIKIRSGITGKTIEDKLKILSLHYAIIKYCFISMSLVHKKHLD